MITYIVAFFAFAGGAATSVICGFGMGVFTMMFLPHVMSYTLYCSAVISIVSFLQASWICWHYRKKVQWKSMVFMVLGYFIFSTLSIHYGKNISGPALELALGIFLVVLGIYFITIASKVRLNPNKKTAFGAGCVGGVMSSLFGVGGPPAGLYYSAAFDDKEMYLGTIQSYFMITNFYVSCVRAVTGIITREVLICACFGVAGMILGTFAGKKVFDRINAVTMKKLIYALMIFSGAVMIIQNI